MSKSNQSNFDVNRGVLQSNQVTITQSASQGSVCTVHFYPIDDQQENQIFILILEMQIIFTFAKIKGHIFCNKLINVQLLTFPKKEKKTNKCPKSSINVLNQSWCLLVFQYLVSILQKKKKKKIWCPQIILQFFILRIIIVLPTFQV